ncbi:pyridoxamine 5'-phosphate oxidase family protein [Candidatus Uhrbacteria bacterium]|nr:pyridoxamine 5'-phosphate oxidase family protein [Candidatus Uhrbacteria bacterium]
MWLRSRIREVLDRGYFIHLATMDDAGPWACTLIYIHDDDLRLYWMSDPDTRHSKAITANAKVAAAITVSEPHTPNLGVQVTGTATVLRGRRYDLAVKHFVKRRKAPPSKVVDVLQGDKWYCLTPTSFELIDEEHFGFEKQRLVVHE